MTYPPEQKSASAPLSGVEYRLFPMKNLLLDPGVPNPECVFPRFQDLPLFFLAYSEQQYDGSRVSFISCVISSDHERHWGGFSIDTCCHRLACHCTICRVNAMNTSSSNRFRSLRSMSRFRIKCATRATRTYKGSQGEST